MNRYTFESNYILRDLELNDIAACKCIVQFHWGNEIADNAELELLEMFSKQRWPPHYLVAVDDEERVLGFAGYKPAWLMSNAFEMIWINIAPWAQGKGIGRALTERRLIEIDNAGGTMVMLMTKKPKFFERFGFRLLDTLDGWVLMLKQLRPVVLADRDK